MPVDTAIESWQGLVRIAGEHARIHITGGEPFLYFDRLADICKAACEQRLGPVDVIETNGSTWESPGELTEQLRILDACGLNRIKVSWDIFHEEFINIEKVREFVSIARDTMGPERVLVRWEKHLDASTGIDKMNPEQRKAAFLAAIKTDSCRFTGRAAQSLAPLAASHKPEEFLEQNCQNALLSAKGVHIDPYGNVFNGQCSGMIVGNVNRTPLDELWKTFEPDRLDFWKDLYKKGPLGLLDSGLDPDFQPLEKYAGKCHLCTDIRGFFFDRGTDSMIIGPNDCYGTYDLDD